jgi:hypothetical protein
MQNWVNKFLSPAIGSTTTLIHVFIIALFFESFYILTERKSLLEITFDFKEIPLAPFLYFFFFLAVTKLIWLGICAILSRFISDENKTSSHKSYVTFLLPLLIFTYLYIISEKHPGCAPISEKHWWLSKLYEIYWLTIALLSAFRFIFFLPEKYTNE